MSKELERASKSKHKYENAYTKLCSEHEALQIKEKGLAKKLEKKERSLTNIRREMKELETKVDELTEENQRFQAMAQEGMGFNENSGANEFG